MQTVFFENFRFDKHSLPVRIGLLIYMTAGIFIVMTASGLFYALLYAILLLSFACFSYWLIIKSQVAFSLTPVHFQQHLYQGGWIIKWNNISNIGQCTFNQDGWQQPLPWIGIRIKDYSPFLDSICPRVISGILLNQRGLLFWGLKQHPEYKYNFEDIVLDAGLYRTTQGKTYDGLQAMLANRMTYQRKLHGYDIFISVHDLGSTVNDLEFIGLARRYIAAAEPDNQRELI